MVKYTKEEALASKTFCPLAFNHLFAQPSGDIQACCVAGPFKKNANIKHMSIHEAFNSPNHKKLREDMIKGIENPVCDICYSSEKVGGFSTRLMNQHKLATGVYSVPDISDDFEVPSDFEHIDIRFSNLCNLKCRMCNHMYSSAWFEDAKAIGKAYPNYTKVIDIGNNITTRLVDHIKNVKTVYFAGGEPLIMPEHLETLKVLTEVHKDNIHPRLKKINISIHYNTNLKVLKHDGVEFIKYWKKYQRVNLSISCDGINEVGEYQRVGFETDRFVKNLTKLVDSGFLPQAGFPKEYNSNLLFNFQYTVTPINILHLPEFIDFLLDNNFIDTSSVVDFRYAHEPEEFNIRNIVNKEYVSRYLTDKMKNYDNFSKNALSQLINHMNQPARMEPHKVFNYLGTLDVLNRKQIPTTHKQFTDPLFL